MSRRGAPLADSCDRAIEAVIKRNTEFPPDTVHRKCPAEGCTAAVIAAHVALSPDFLIDRVRRIVADEERPPFDAVAFHGGNARSPRENAELSSGQVIALLQDHGTRAAEFVRGLSSDDLDRSRLIPVVGDNPTPVEQFVERVLIEHGEGHRQSLRQCLMHPEPVPGRHHPDPGHSDVSTI